MFTLKKKILLWTRKPTRKIEVGIEILYTLHINQIN